MTLSISGTMPTSLTMWHITELDDKHRSVDTGRVQLTLGGAASIQLDREDRLKAAAYLLDGLGLDALVAASGFTAEGLVEQVTRRYALDVDHDALSPDDYERPRS